ncbi:hypothetical protein BJV77DRAFT_1032595 [Russula vinacea]|nr:hypothetical protein BJV77DRAFT_1032595 [Russula vinacea]
MVSFQYVPCTDVVKKPKLDRHYGQCRSSFTCIDCSKTFAGPIEWKGHTSCITEAEKYQKSVYKALKNLQGQDSRPGNGHQDNIQLITTNATGKYRQSRSNQSSWSRNPYIRNCASGANTTPLGSPLRMSPADTSATEHGEGKKRDSDLIRDETTDVAPEHPQKEASRVNGSPEGHKRSENSGDDPRSKTQPPTEGSAEARDVSTPPEPLSASVDEKKIKKRKHKEKKEEDEETNHDGTAATKLEPLTSQMDDAKGQRKKRKDKEEKASGEKRKHEDAVANDVEKKRRKHR